MEALLLLCLFPVAWPFIAKRIWDTTITYQEMGLQILIITIVLTATWQLGKWGATSDTEVWNGIVTSKERNHDWYQTSYDCNCTTDSKGNSSCSTCYTDHYTVDWITKTSVGNVTLKSLDSEWRSVYNTPDPASYTNCKIGEPASIEHGYTNYVQAVPNSLFNDADYVDATFDESIPPYPSVYSFYKFNHVISVGSAVDPAIRKSINTTLGNTLRTLGKQKQVNIIVLFTNIEDPSYRFAVEAKWLGGKKNDVVVFVGTKGNDILWADVMTWALNSGNELFQVKLKDALSKMKTVSEPEFSTTITDTIAKHYDRPEMKDYEYLASEVSPAPWVIYLAIFLSIFGSIGLTYFFHVKDVDLFNKKGYSRRRY